MMSAAASEFGIVGLGRIGAGIAHHAIEQGMRVVGTSRSGAPRELVAAGLTEITGVSGFRAQLRRPRAVLLYIPAGPAVDTMLDELAKALEPGDVVVDGGNSYWGDSIRRHARLRELGIQFVEDRKSTRLNSSHSQISYAVFCLKKKR